MLTLKEKISRDRWYFFALGIIAVFFVLVFTFQQEIIEIIKVKITDIELGGKTYSLDLFDGILFTLFISATVFLAWYFGGHNAFMITAISWNFEILLFIAITQRPELTIEFVNVFLCLFLYSKESPADRKTRLFNEMIEQKNRELELQNIAYFRFVPENFLKILNKNCIADVKLGDSVQREMTILFSDIRNFTKISESLSPKENFEFINDYLSKVGPIIREENGFIDKYIGDAIMALFPENPTDAISCAIKMQKALISFNDAQQQKGFAPIKIGIGIHCGNLMLGTIGEHERMDSTVISDAVNLASRLESLTKVYKCNIIVSGEVIEKIRLKNAANPDKESDFEFRYIDKVKVKGKDKAVKIFEILDKQSGQGLLRIKTLEDYNKGMEAFQNQKTEEAYHYFKKLLELNPDDFIVKVYLNRIGKKNSCEGL